MQIRNLQPTDYDLIESWWKTAGEIAPPFKHMPIESTFVLLYQGNPVVSVGYFATNTDIALAQNFIADPSLDKFLRREFTTIIHDHLERHAKKYGYNILLGFTSKEKLGKRYEDLGYKQVNMIFVAKEI